jgi:serine/threonine protein kinase
MPASPAVHLLPASPLHTPTCSQVRQRNATKPALRFALSWDTRLSVAEGAAAGVAFMHHHGIVHRDLTSSNLVLDLAKGGGAAWVAKVRVTRPDWG